MDISLPCGVDKGPSLTAGEGTSRGGLRSLLCLVPSQAWLEDWDWQPQCLLVAYLMWPRGSAASPVVAQGSRSECASKEESAWPRETVVTQAWRSQRHTSALLLAESVTQVLERDIDITSQ